MVKIALFFFINFGLRFLKHFGENVELCEIDKYNMKRMREVLLFKANFRPNACVAEVNNLTDSSLDFRREFEWENMGIRIGFLYRSCSYGCLLSKETCFI